MTIKFRDFYQNHLGAKGNNNSLTLSKGSYEDSEKLCVNYLIFLLPSCVTKIKTKNKYHYVASNTNEGKMDNFIWMENAQIFFCQTFSSFCFHLIGSHVVVLVAQIMSLTNFIDV